MAKKESQFSTAKLQAEINERKVNIDQSVFTKTNKEKDALKAMKAAYKKANK